jgi:hypothetical protein
MGDVAMKLSVLAVAALASSLLAASAIKAEPADWRDGSAVDACRHHVIGVGPVFAKDFRICAYLVTPLGLEHVQPAALNSAGTSDNQQDLSVIRAYIRTLATNNYAND